MILLLRSRATPQQLEQMLQQHKFYIKTAVDLERLVLIGGGCIVVAHHGIGITCL